MGAYSEPRHNGGGIALRSHREQQRTAICVATAVCSTRAGGFSSHKATDPLEMWPAMVRTAQCRAAQLAGVGDVREKLRPHAR